MQFEIEAKFISINIDDVRRRLKRSGGELKQPMRLMRRVVFHNKILVKKDAFVRIRNEGDKITITYKQFDDADSIHGVKEIETTLGGFDEAIAIFEQSGLSKDSYQETKRENWQLGEVQIMIDEWPWINPFIEIEGPSEMMVHQTAETLGFKWKDAVFGGVASVYARHYSHISTNKRFAKIINLEIPIIRFDDPVPEVISGLVAAD